MFLNKQTTSNVKFGIGYNHTKTPTDFTPKTVEDGSRIVQNQTSDMKDCTSFHQNFLKIEKESSTEVLNKTDIKP